MTVSAVETAPMAFNPARGIRARLSGLISILIAVTLALTPFSAVLVLGWIMRIMRREIVIALCRQGAQRVKRKNAIAHIASVPAVAGMSRFPGWWRGLGETFRAGAKATVAVAIAVLPFGALQLLSWWAGWENSFNKGYEQAWVGPTIALIGIFIAVFVLMHLPMALAHFAAEGRIGAIWEITHIRRLIARTRWRYLFLSLFTVSLSAPLYIGQIMPTFIEGVFPHLAAASPEQLKAFAFRWHAGFTIYLVLVLLVLRRWAARLYARAAVADGSSRVIAMLARDMNVKVPEPARRPGRVAGTLSTLVTAAAWFAFVAALYVTQFANHAWWNWLNHPIIGLPWVFRPY